MTRDPRVWPRGTDNPVRERTTAPVQPAPDSLLDGAQLIVVVYAPRDQVARWVEGELERDGSMVQTARTLPHLMRALVEDPPPRPNILVVDVDALSPAELMELHSIRERGWFGTVIGLGRVPPALRISLGVDHVLTPPFVQDQLRDAVAGLRTPVSTSVVPIIRDER
jgi:hypothetical protein